MYTSASEGTRVQLRTGQTWGSMQTSVWLGTVELDLQGSTMIMLFLHIMEMLCNDDYSLELQKAYTIQKLSIDANLVNTA